MTISELGHITSNEEGVLGKAPMVYATVTWIARVTNEKVLRQRSNEKKLPKTIYKRKLNALKTRYGATNDTTRS